MNIRKSGKTPTLKEQRAFHDDWNIRFRSGDYSEIKGDVGHRAIKVIEYLSALDLASPEILEVGCGTGWLSERLCNYGLVTAIDLSPEAIEIAKRRNIEAKFIADDFYSHEFDKSSYDLIVCNDVLFNIPDQEIFVEHLAKLQKAGDVLIATTINKFVFERRDDVDPPDLGKPRDWLSISDTKRLLSPFYDVLKTETVDPKGNQGVLRLVNSTKVNKILGKIFSPSLIRRAKERLGLGAGVVILARRK